MSKVFRGATNVAHSLVNVAQRSGNMEAARQAQIVAKMVKGLARLEKGFEIEGQQLTAALLKLQKAVKGQTRPPPRGGGGHGGDQAGYYVQITGGRDRPRSGGFRAADTGLIGRRVGRGPVRMTSADGQSAKAVTAAFSKLLSAQSQLQKLRTELEGLKARR
jgi:hypothetical protein